MGVKLSLIAKIPNIYGGHLVAKGSKVGDQWLVEVARGKDDNGKYEDRTTPIDALEVAGIRHVCF